MIQACIWLKKIPCPGRVGGALSLQNGGSPPLYSVLTQAALQSAFVEFSMQEYMVNSRRTSSDCKSYFLNFLVLARINAQRGKTRTNRKQKKMLENLLHEKYMVVKYGRGWHSWYHVTSPLKWKANHCPRKKTKITEASHTRCNRLRH